MTAELVDAATGAQVWSERWDRPAQDMFSVQAEVADKVAVSLGGITGSNPGAIKSRLLSEAKQRAWPNIFPPTASGRSPLNNGDCTVKAGTVKGLEYIEKAISLDPNLASAYAAARMAQNAKGPLCSIPHGRRRLRNSKATGGWRWRLTLQMLPQREVLIWYFAIEGQWAELIHQNRSHSARQPL